jgi:(2Fe-2S) ferredoxin
MVELIVKEDIPNVTILPDGHISTGQDEPVVMVMDGDKKTVYKNVDEAAAVRIINEHIQNGKVVADHLDKKAKK